MISVLCDPFFFAGAYEHLSEARDHCDLPLLCKEFVIDTCQLDAARAYGADAVLLIVRILDQDALPRLVGAARDRGLSPLVEVVTQDESRRALEAGADWIGVNARDLDTLNMDPERAQRVLDELPSAVTAVHLSGLHTPEDVARVAAGRADAALIGEALMRADHPRDLLQRLQHAAKG